ncbi:MAG TPA: GH1 family beta-glucosidase [Micromonosporaceae bacterium]|nr:GH1 family beta-glucosidase [Micromonosporaceae bacterium]
MTTPSLPDFPADFTWGVATSSYQIEGATTEGGRGPSIWDTFTHQPGRIADGSTGDVACDHYRRYREDVALMAGLGVSAYRFSIAWPRIQPDGVGPANPNGLDFYDRLVDALLEQNIDPVATLYHWDLPQRLEDDGGWLNRQTAHRFADYTALIAARLGDRVKLWITLNEPFVHMTYGYAMGVHAPGHTHLFDALPVAHHQLLGHGLAVRVLRDNTTSPVAITNNYSPVWPLGRPRRDRNEPGNPPAPQPSPADLTAVAAFDALQNRLFTDPLLGRGYPDELGGVRSVVRDGDLEVIAAPIDVLGVNYYSPTGIRAPDQGTGPLPFELVPLEGYPITSFDWPVVPDGLHELLVDLMQRYGADLPPIHITENGCSYDDVIDADGRCRDPQRVSYLDGPLRALHRAIDDGVDVRGYFTWSLLDNFEWAEGFTKRFGLVHVDFDTQVRTPKTSYSWYRDVITRGR